MKSAARASAVTETHGFSNDIHIAGISRAPAVVLQQSEAPYGSSHWENDVAPEAGSEAYTNELVKNTARHAPNETSKPQNRRHFCCSIQEQYSNTTDSGPGETEALYSALCPQMRWYLQNEHPAYLGD